MASEEFDRQRAERQQRIEKARGPFEAIRRYMHVARFTGGKWSTDELPVFRRLHDALNALSEWRMANQQRNEYQDEIALSIRIVADSMASEIAAAAGADQDPQTIAWVVAGLRCPLRPFCRGCDACFAIDAPHRADVAFAATRPDPGGAS